jgi:hypothetical protein
MLITMPDLRFTMDGTTACVTRTAEKKFVSKASFDCCREISMMGPACAQPSMRDLYALSKASSVPGHPAPALLMRMSMAPSRSMTVVTARCTDSSLSTSSSSLSTSDRSVFIFSMFRAVA